MYLVLSARGCDGHSLLVTYEWDVIGLHIYVNRFHPCLTEPTVIKCPATDRHCRTNACQPTYRAFISEIPPNSHSCPVFSLVLRGLVLSFLVAVMSTFQDS